MSGAVVFPNGQKLNALRARLGWTQAEAANKIRYSERLIRKAEKGLPIRGRTLRDLVAGYSDWLPCDIPLQWEQFQLDIYLSDTASETDWDEIGKWSASANRMASRIVNYFYQVYNQRRLDWVRTLIHPDVKFTSEGETRIGVEAVEKRTCALLDGFNPIYIRFDFDRFHFGDQQAAFSFIAEMTHVGDFFGIGPTARQVIVRNSSFVTFENELLVEILDQTDMVSLFSQLRNEPPAIL